MDDNVQEHAVAERRMINKQAYTRYTRRFTSTEPHVFQCRHVVSHEHYKYRSIYKLVLYKMYTSKASRSRQKQNKINNLLLYKKIGKEAWMNAYGK